MSSRSAIVCLLASALAIAGCDRKSPAPAQANTVAADEVAPDEVPPTAAPQTGGLDRSHKGEAAAPVTFETPDGKPVTLATFKGKPLLLNLWATWCAPCVKEMPTLEGLAKTAGDRMTVLAVSQDMEGTAKVAPFFAKEKLVALEPYRDPKLGLSLAYQANLPMTILFDSAGKEVWRFTGAKDWTSDEAKALIAEAK